MNILVSPHSDDESLFASYIILRNKPLTVLVCTDGILHQERFGIDPEVRRQESREACKILGCEVEFLGLSDKRLVLSDLKKVLKKYNPDTVFAPAKTGGHKQHDAISDLVTQLWADKVWYYGTYTKDDLSPAKGRQGLVPSPDEQRLKHMALACYKSQLGINAPHFQAVMNAQEYLTPYE